MQTSSCLPRPSPPLQPPQASTAVDRLDATPSLQQHQHQIRRRSHLVDYRCRKASLPTNGSKAEKEGDEKLQRHSLPCSPSTGQYHVEDDPRARRATMVDYVPSTITTIASPPSNEGADKNEEAVQPEGSITRDDASELSPSLNPEEKEK